MRLTYKHLLGALFALMALGAVSTVSAYPSWIRALFQKHTVIYVHGMKFKDYSYCQGKSTCKGAWDQQRKSGLLRVVHTGWDGRMDPGVMRKGRGSYQLLRNLNKYCRRDQGKSCQVVCGSMGCYTTSLTISRYNSSRRYNVTHVISLAGADGGSITGHMIHMFARRVAAVMGLAPSVFLKMFTDRRLSIVNAVKPSRARAAFDHNRNNGTQFYHKVGYLPPLINTGGWIRLIDRSDGIVPFSSACAYRSISKFRKCGGERVRVGWRICWPGRWGRKCRRRNFRTISPWTGHHASTSISNRGIPGWVHGYFSKYGGYFHKYK